MPYRLQVAVVESRRVGRKTRKETIGTLGSIDAAWLGEFWAGAPEALRARDWTLRSLEARAAFWEEVHRRLAKLVDRLGPDLVPLGLAVHKRVPWLSEAERKLLPALKSEAEAETWFGRHAETARQIEENERLIDEIAGRNDALRWDALQSLEQAKAAQARAAALRSGI